MILAFLMLLHDDDDDNDYSSPITPPGKKSSPLLICILYTYIVLQQSSCLFTHLRCQELKCGISIFPQIVDRRVEEVMRMRNEADISALLSVQWGFTIIFEQ